MKFELSTSGMFYEDDKESIMKLEEIGFTFEPYYSTRYKITDVKPEIEINTIDELIKFTDKYGKIVVKGKTIEVYNAFRE